MDFILMVPDGILLTKPLWIKLSASCISLCLSFTSCLLKIMSENQNIIDVHAIKLQIEQVSCQQLVRVPILFCLLICQPKCLQISGH